MKKSTATTVIVLSGLLLLMTMVVVTALNRSRQSAPEEEIVFEPEEVDLDEGSATLDITWATTDSLGFASSGAEEISLKITPDEEVADRYQVHGSLTSMQSVGMSAMDQGNECTFNILHDVEYGVTGTFVPATCTFELYAGMKPTASELLSHDCSIDLALDIGGFYMSPPPGKIVFVDSSEPSSGISKEYSFSLFDVMLPTGVVCVGFGG